MCGIFGLLSHKKISAQDVERLRVIEAALMHRGPDAKGLWQEGEVALGHTRLSILDLTASGNQPMSCIEGKYQIVFNGEIYNFVELKRELIGKGYTFRSETDTEVIAAAYDAWGTGCFQRFNGMWAFALWDRRNKMLFLARDRYGIKPLYYIYRNTEFVFASEVSALHFWLGKEAELESDVITDISMGNRGYHGTTKTYLKQVVSLPAGSFAIMKEGTLEIKQWYVLQRAIIPSSLSEQKEMFRALFLDACRLRLRSDVPVATCLSGGIDSSSIVSILHRFSDFQNVERMQSNFHSSFCLGFQGTELDEVNLARKLTNDIGAKLHVLEIGFPQPQDIISAMHLCDGPMPNLAFYPISTLYGFVRRNGIKVTLDGLGPDEALGGYNLSKIAFTTALKMHNVAWLREAYQAYSAQGEFAFYSARKKARYNLLTACAGHYLPKGVMGFVRAIKNCTAPSITSGECTARDQFTVSTPEGLDAFQQVLFGMFFQDTLPMLLHQYDRCSMAYGVESRLPFLDYRLVEFMFSLPHASILGGGYTKRILREAMEGVVPEDIRTRKVKIGFHPPQYDWFRGPLREWMRDIMNSPTFRKSPFFDGVGLLKMFERFLESGQNKSSFELAGIFWGPVHVAWWLDNSLAYHEKL